MIEYKDAIIPLSAISVSPVHHNIPITEKDKKEIGESLAKFGQLQQLVVRRIPNGKRKDLYELLAGRMRYEAMKAEGIRLARCAVVDVNDKTAEIISIVENLHRRAIDEAQKRKSLARYAELIAEDIQRQQSLLEERHKVSGTRPRGRPESLDSKVAKQVSKDLKVGVSQVKAARKLQENLCPSACRALDRGQITKEQALFLSRMPLSKQIDELSRMLKETQSQSRERLAKERIIESDPTEATLRMLKKTLAKAQEACDLAQEIIDFVNKKKITWSKVRDVDSSILIKAGNTLLDLHGVIHTDEVD